MPQKASRSLVYSAFLGDEYQSKEESFREFETSQYIAISDMICNQPLIRKSAKYHYARNLMNGFSVYLKDNKEFQLDSFTIQSISHHFIEAAAKAYIWEIAIGVIPYKYVKDPNMKEQLIPIVPDFFSGRIKYRYDYERYEFEYRFYPENDNETGIMIRGGGRPRGKKTALATDQMYDKEMKFLSIPLVSPEPNGLLNSDLSKVIKFLNTANGYEMTSQRIETSKTHLPFALQQEFPNNEYAIQFVADLLKEQNSRPVHRIDREGATGLAVPMLGPVAQSVDKAEREQQESMLKKSVTFGLLRSSIHGIVKDVIRQSASPFSGEGPNDSGVYTERDNVRVVEGGNNVFKVVDNSSNTIKEIHAPPMNKLIPLNIQNPSVSAMDRWNAFYRELASVLDMVHTNSSSTYKVTELETYTATTQSAFNMTTRKSLYEKLMTIWYWDIFGSEHIQAKEEFVAEYMKRKQMLRRIKAQEEETKRQLEEKKKALEHYKKTKNGKSLKEPAVAAALPPAQARKKDGYSKHVTNHFAEMGLDASSLKPEQAIDSLKQDIEHKKKILHVSRQAQKKIKQEIEIVLDLPPEQEIEDEIEARKVIQVANTFVHVKLVLNSRNFMLTPNLAELQRNFMNGMITPEDYADTMLQITGIKHRVVSPDEIFKKELDRDRMRAQATATTLSKSAQQKDKPSTTTTTTSDRKVGQTNSDPAAKKVEANINRANTRVKNKSLAASAGLNSSV